MSNVAISTLGKPMNPALAASQAVRRAPAPQARMTAGMLVRRPDLSDEAVLSAIADRLVFEGRDPAHAAGVLKAALAGKPIAKAMLRKLVLPAPRASLAMPTQAILREKKQRQGSSSWLRMVSFGR